MSFFNLTNQHLSQIEEVLNQIYTAHTFKSLLPESFVVTVKNFFTDSILIFDIQGIWLEQSWAIDISRSALWSGSHGSLHTSWGAIWGVTLSVYIQVLFCWARILSLLWRIQVSIVLLVLLDCLKMVLRDYHGLSMVKSSYVTKNLMVTQWLTQISFFILLSIKAWWSSLLSIECSHGHLSYPAQNFPLDFSHTHRTKRPTRCTVWLCRIKKWRLWL